MYKSCRFTLPVKESFVNALSICIYPVACMLDIFKPTQLLYITLAGFVAHLMNLMFVSGQL